GAYFTLRKELTPSNAWEYVLTDVHGMTIRFEFATVLGSDIWYRLKSIKDPNGNTISVAYNSTTGFPTQLTDTLGQTTTIAYHTLGVGAAGRVKTITTPNGAVMSYGYNTSGQLTRVTLPPTSEYPAGSDVTYTYDAASHLTSITEAGQSQPFIVNTYDQTY